MSIIRVFNLSTIRNFFIELYTFISSAPIDKSRIFVTTPRSFSDGVPISLGYFKSPTTSCLIHPYPDYSWHSSNGESCEGLTSVFRVAIDDCNQMWVVDSGVVNNTRKCPPQLFVFNLFNDALIHRYTFPKSQYDDLSLFITPVRLFYIKSRLIIKD